MGADDERVVFGKQMLNVPFYYSFPPFFLSLQPQITPSFVTYMTILRTIHHKTLFLSSTHTPFLELVWVVLDYLERPWCFFILHYRDSIANIRLALFLPFDEPRNQNSFVNMKSTYYTPVRGIDVQICCAMYSAKDFI